MSEPDLYDEALHDALVALRELRSAYGVTLAAFDYLIEQADPGFEPDAVADFDERSIAMEYLGDIRRGIEDLLRLLAATKGRHALGELVQRSEAVIAERERLAANEPMKCVRCGAALSTPREGGQYTLDSDGPRCPDEVACDARRRRIVD